MLETMVFTSSRVTQPSGVRVMVTVPSATVVVSTLQSGK